MKCLPFIFRHWWLLVATDRYYRLIKVPCLPVHVGQDSLVHGVDGLQQPLPLLRHRRHSLVELLRNLRQNGLNIRDPCVPNMTMMPIANGASAATNYV